MTFPPLGRRAAQGSRGVARLTMIARKLLRRLSPNERRIVVALVGVVLVATGFLVAERFRSVERQPVRGGTYTEGVVAASLADVEPTVHALTHVGLVASNERGELTGRLAERWEVSADAKRFEFQLKPGVDRATVLRAYDPSVEESPFAGTTVEPIGERGIRVTVNASYSPFLATFTRPLIPLGPYVVASRQRESVTLVARPDYFEGQPYLETIILQLFPTNSPLEQALRRRAVDGVAQVGTTLTIPEGFNRYELTLPRQTAAFFNLERPALEALATRRRLAAKERFDEPLSLQLVTTETLAMQEDVRALIADWRAANVALELTVLPAARVQREVIPNRDYDVLIFGIDYGADPDPYPFWHSSQRKLTGLNLANFANVDADKLLEEARQLGSTDERAKRYEQFNRILEREQPWFVLNEVPWTFAVVSEIRGPASQRGFQPADRYRTVHEWYRVR